MGFRILIADDEPLIRADLRELLETLGHEVIAEAGNGKEAAALIEKKKPDLVILDIKMPGMDGLKVASWISHLYPVIILSAFTESQLIEMAREAGVMAYLSKPFRETDISPAIELAVNHFLERSALADWTSFRYDSLRSPRRRSRCFGHVRNHRVSDILRLHQT